MVRPEIRAWACSIALALDDAIDTTPLSAMSISAPGLVERLLEDLAGQAVDLDVHLQRADSAPRAGDLEVHVAEVVLVAEDVGQDDVVIALLHEAHRDAG